MAKQKLAPLVDGNTLDGLLVIELSRRTACAVAGSLLAQSGAAVVALEPHEVDVTEPRQHALYSGKRCIDLSQDDGEYRQLRALLEVADVVLTSSDDEQFHHLSSGLQDQAVIVVDVMGFSRSRCDDGAASLNSDTAIQAVSGMMSVTGMADGPPCLQDGEPLEFIAALHAFIATLAGLHTRERDQCGQSASVALFDCALSSHAIFVSNIIESATAPARRSGNRHQLASPWNIFATTDGWLLICMATELQWQRLCELMGEPELAFSSGFAGGTERQQNIEAVEARVQAWVGTMARVEVSAVLQNANIPCGSVAVVDGYPREANLSHRKMVAEGELNNGARVYSANSPLRASVTPGISLPPPATADDAWIAAQLAPRERRFIAQSRATNDAPLKGLRVIEVGQFTTAPVAGRYLAQLGAEVIKVESLGGETMRKWAPQRHGIGAFFVVNNTGKRHVTLDLKTPSGLRGLEQLIGGADVLIENLKPQALARLGLDWERLQQLKPDLIYCAVSGFGADSVYPGRAAYDTVVQAMSGVMDGIRTNGVPLKTGMSLADILGANFSVGAILAALRFRDLAGHGQFIDVSMQDVAAWSTQLLWNDLPRAQARSVTLACAGGHVLVHSAEPPAELIAMAAVADRSTLRARWPSLVSPVQTFNESLASPLAAGQMQEVADAQGRCWPVLTNPIQLTRTPLEYAPVLAGLGGDNSTYLSE